MTAEEKVKRLIEERNLDPELVGRMQKIFGYTDEEILKTTPKQYKSWKAQDKLPDWFLVAEVIESHNCGARNRVGDRYVAQSATALMPEECTVRYLCTGAMESIWRMGSILYERLAEGLDPRDFAANEYAWCLDTGIEQGGYGKILLKFSFQHISEFKSMKDKSPWVKVSKK